MIHYLKIEDRWLVRVRANEKMAELRYDDRDYTGARRKITHVLREVEGIEAGYVILSLADPRVEELRERAERAEKSNAPLRGTITRLTRERDEARAEAES